jgi:hypothetical protein
MSTLNQAAITAGSEKLPYLNAKLIQLLLMLRLEAFSNEFRFLELLAREEAQSFVLRQFYRIRRYKRLQLSGIRAHRTA